VTSLLINDGDNSSALENAVKRVEGSGNGETLPAVK